MKGLIDLGNGITAFIDGVDDCDHKWNGPSYFYLSNGKRIGIETNLKWAGYTDQFRTLLIYQTYDNIVESGCTCSKCGKDFNPYWDMEGFWK